MCYRYEDNIFIAWDYGLFQIYAFLKRIHNMDPNMKFTIEIGETNDLPLLDIVLINNLSRLTLERTIYQKVNKSNDTIPFNSTSLFKYHLFSKLFHSTFI